MPTYEVRSCEMQHVEPNGPAYRHLMDGSGYVQLWCIETTTGEQFEFVAPTWAEIDQYDQAQQPTCTEMHCAGFKVEHSYGDEACSFKPLHNGELHYKKDS